MEITLLIKSIAGLVLILGILLYFLFAPSKKIKKIEQIKVTPQAEEGMKTDLPSLVSLIKKSSTTKSELEKALRLVIKHHGKIHPKMGLRTHPDFYTYRDIIIAICRHPNTTKDIIIDFDRDLNQLNPDYKQDIHEAMTKGLNSRGI